MRWLPSRRRLALEPEVAAPAVGEPVRNPGVLRELAPEEVFGAVEVRAEDPVMHLAEDVLFVPTWYRDDDRVFDSSGQPVEAALDFAFPWCEPMHPPRTSSVAWSEVERTLPDADYLYLGYFHFHFGHFVTDSLSRIWPLLDRGVAGRKLLYHGAGAWESWQREFPWLPEMLTALGVRESDLLHLTEPVRIRRLQIPGRSWQSQTFAHQVHQRVCRRLGEHILKGVKPRGGPPVYLSKTRLTGGVRRVTNEAKLEAFLRPRGVDVLYPEAMPTRDKIALFANGRTVTGTTSSAFNLSLFAPPAGRIIALEPMAQVNSTHPIVDKLNGNTSTYLHAVGSRRTASNTDGWMSQDTFLDPVAVGRELLQWI